MTTNTEKQFGIIQAFNPMKGFGFIRRNIGGKDAFFFFQDVEHSDALIAQGDIVSFTIKTEPKGPRAYNISKEG